MKKRVISFLLSVVLIGSLMPVPADAASESSITKKLDEYVAFLESYGTPHWNAEIRSSDSTSLLMEAVNRGDWSYGLTSSACHGSNANGSNTHWRGKTVNGEHGCDSNIFGGAAQCFGFAKYLCYVLYGSYPTVNILNARYSSKTYSDGFTYYKKDVAYPGLQVGDMIRYENTSAGTHAAIIYSIGANGELTVVDCNTKSDPCVVRKHIMYLTNGKLTEATFKKYYEEGRAYICRYNGTTTPVSKSVTATTKGVDSDLSASNATLRAYVSSSGEKLIECGMYIGTSSSIESMVKLGSDSINTYGTKCFYKTSKYGYKLEAGQTYYYAAYAKTASKTAYGEVKSFTVPGAAPKITLNETGISASENTCVQLVATTTPSGQTVTWSSSDTTVAAVSSTGQVECKSFGTATITAKMVYKDKTYTATCKVTVQCGDHTYSGGICSKCQHEWKHTETAMNATTFEVTNKDGAPLWSRPYSNNSKQIKTLAKGTAVTIVASTKNQAGNLWYKTEDGYWIYSGNVKKCEEAKTKTYYVTKAGDNNHLAINSVAKSGNQIGRIPSGAAVKVYPDKTSGNWLYVEYNGVKGYAYSGYLTTSKPATKVGTVTGTNGQHLAINTLPSASGTGGSVKVGRIPPGAQITVYTELSVGNWYWVEYNGVFGFAYSGYIKLS